jgi:hypothetical protein
MDSNLHLSKPARNFTTQTQAETLVTLFFKRFFILALSYDIPFVRCTAKAGSGFALTAPDSLFGLESLIDELQRSAVFCDRSNNLIWRTSRDFRIYLESHSYRRADQAGEVRDHLVGNAPRVAPYARCIENHGTVKATGFR